jgi:excisionase family DNA binding protein
MAKAPLTRTEFIAQYGIEPFMRPREVAAYLGVSVDHVRQWRKYAGMPFCRVGTTYRYVKADVDAWMRQRIRATPYVWRDPAEIPPRSREEARRYAEGLSQ